MRGKYVVFDIDFVMLHLPVHKSINRLFNLDCNLRNYFTTLYGSWSTLIKTALVKSFLGSFSVARKPEDGRFFIRFTQLLLSTLSC
jgi:hypothetical protein